LGCLEGIYEGIILGIKQSWNSCVFVIFRQVLKLEIFHFVFYL